jgi:hypothetical protein
MNIHILNYKNIIQELLSPFTEDHPMFAEYLYKGRQDILVNTDIFCNNVRSKDLKEVNFNLFNRTTLDDSKIVVFPIYLELFEFLGLRENIEFCIENYSTKFPDKKVVFFWNHDIDFKYFNHITSKHDNCIIINYNTSEKTDNDIIVPFWTIQNIDFLEEEKNTFCSFIGSINSLTRRELVDGIIKYNNSSIIYQNGLDYDEYRKRLSQTIFSLCPHGAGLSSWRFFECIHANTIPVLISDNAILPYQEEIDYSDFSVTIDEIKAMDTDWIFKHLSSIDSDNLLKNLKDIRHMFTLEGVQNYIYNKLDEKI